MSGNKYGLIGLDLKHSFSQSYFNQKFAKEKLVDTYTNFSIQSIQTIRDLVTEHNLSGFNVTIPYKEQIIPFLDSISDEAKTIGAVNTVKVVDSKLYGYNTDVIGFRKSIGPFLEDYHTKALVLGTGGAAKAVAHVLRLLEMSVLFVSRNPNQEDQVAYEYITPKVMQEYLVVINTTPVGTTPDTDQSPFDATQFMGKYHVAYDLIYNPSETLFLKNAKTQNANIKNGLEMLEIQAEESWKIWMDET